MKMGDSFNNNTQSIADYLGQLLKDKKQLAAFPNVFIHVERLLDDGKNLGYFRFFPRGGGTQRMSRGFQPEHNSFSVANPLNPANR